MLLSDGAMADGASRWSLRQLDGGLWALLRCLGFPSLEGMASGAAPWRVNGRKRPKRRKTQAHTQGVGEEDWKRKRRRGGFILSLNVLVLVKIRMPRDARDGTR